MCDPGAMCRMLRSRPPTHGVKLPWLYSAQELGLPVNVVEKNFLKDPSVLETDEFKKINPAGKCVSSINPYHRRRVSLHLLHVRSCCCNRPERCSSVIDATLRVLLGSRSAHSVVPQSISLQVKCFHACVITAGCRHSKRVMPPCTSPPPACCGCWSSTVSHCFEPA